MGDGAPLVYWAGQSICFPLSCLLSPAKFSHTHTNARKKKYKHKNKQIQTQKLANGGRRWCRTGQVSLLSPLLSTFTVYPSQCNPRHQCETIGRNFCKYNTNTNTNTNTSITILCLYYPVQSQASVKSK